jgi:nucleotide-binding universal stress UspA family protein
MTIRMIIAALDGGNGDGEALAASFALAVSLGAHVEGLFARLPASEAIPMIGEGMTGVLVERLMEDAERDWEGRAQAARRTFDAAREAAAIVLADTPPEDRPRASASFRDVEGREDWVITRRAPLADLIVFARPAVAGDSPRLVMALEAALLGGGRPVLVVPPGWTRGPLGRRIAVAWNASREAARAVTGALPLLAGAEAVHVLTGVEDEVEAGTAEALVGYLAWHGIAASPVAIAGGGAILSGAAGVGADLLVMGAYGHSRLREFILGGATRHVLAEAKLPVLAAH